MRPPHRNRTGIVHGALAFFAALLIGRAAQVQLLEGDEWRGRAERQQVTASSLPAPRGAILDATGDVLAESREVVKLSVAPRDVRDLAVLRGALANAGLTPAVVRRASSVEHAWVELPGRFLPADAAPLLALRGVHAAPAIERVYLSAEGTRRIVGHTDGDGAAVDGIELALDSVLQGQLGRARLVRDGRGRSFESPAVSGEDALPGSTVVLTLNRALQDIAEHAVARAMEQTGASGGDIVVLDPHTGEILALASRRAGRALSGVPALVETYEPGSTIKPFLAARLLALGRTRVDEVIATYDGSYRVPGRRTPVRDVHRADTMSVADIIRHSSNVGIVRLAERLTPGEQYEALRDVGFGTATGVAHPSEAAGALPPPGRWSRTTASALAMGYEVAVTPLQLASAYAAVANGGELLQPALIKEIRAPDGTVTYRHERRVVRRAMPTGVAATMRALLASVVDSGTATDATLATYAVGGKSGTARLSADGGYEEGAYTASFVALFPAESPQFVVLVKLDRPQGVYYGGATAGPVSKAVLEAALAARDAALDRGTLARGQRRPAPAEPELLPLPQLAGAGAPAPDRVLEMSSALEPLAPLEPPPAAPVIFSLAAHAVVEATAPPRGMRVVPNVKGLPLRAAVRQLHEAGFQVRLARDARGTAPAAGTAAPAGSVVRLGMPR